MTLNSVILTLMYNLPGNKMVTIVSELVAINGLPVAITSPKKQPRCPICGGRLLFHTCMTDGCYTANLIRKSLATKYTKGRRASP